MCYENNVKLKKRTVVWAIKATLAIRFRKPIVNPAFAKRSVDEKDSSKFKVDRRQMHADNRRQFLNAERMDRRSVEFHRSSRASLYEKIEPLLKA